MANKLLLIDGNSLVYRAYYGSAYTKQGLLTNSKNIPVNAILVFAKMINKFCMQYNPTHLLIAFDAGKKTKRHKVYPKYKAGRMKTPQELKIQIPIIKEMLDHMNISHYEYESYEADDIIGTCAKKFQKFAQVLIISSDKDLFQLIDEKTTVISPQNGAKSPLVYDMNSFEQQVGYSPSKVIDMKGLMGDASDNLPGVSGIGPKNALKLILEYGSLEAIYSNISKISGVLKSNLIKDKDNAYMSKQLATIYTDLSLDLDFSTTV